MSVKRIRLPTVLAGRYVRYVVGFGVAVGVGMAPFLGKYKVPMFEALLELFPEDSKLTLIPLSAFLMGMVAVVIQFYAGEKVPQGTIAKRFAFGSAAILLAFFGLATIYTPERVLRIRNPWTGHNEPVILGWSRGEKCECLPGESDEECAYAVGLDALKICWPSIPQVQLSLHLLYLILTGGFGGLIGLLLLQEEARRQAAEKEAAEKKARKQGKKSKQAGPTALKKESATPVAPEGPKRS